MIQDIISKVDQLSTAFMNAPTEYQVVLGIGALVILAALKNVWGMLLPVRWTAAKVLNGTAAVLMFPKRGPKKPKKVLLGGPPDPGPAPKPKNEPPPFHMTTQEEFEKVVVYYGYNNRSHDLSDQQIETIKEAGHLFRTGNYDSKLQKRFNSIMFEVERREQQRRAEALMARHHQAEEQAKPKTVVVNVVNDHETGQKTVSLEDNIL